MTTGRIPESALQGTRPLPTIPSSTSASSSAAIARRNSSASNLVASRLTVLYGPSGVGKSSLLRAGVVLRLRALVTGGR